MYFIELYIHICFERLFPLTGTSWGTMSILFPLLVIPTFQASQGDALIFYSTIAGVLSGSVAGDHMSPISDTTVSCLVAFSAFFCLSPFPYIVIL